MNLDAITTPIVIKVSQVPWVTTGSVSTTTSLLVSDTISSSFAISLVQGSGGSVTMTSTPTIAVGTYNGQQLILIGVSDSLLVTLQDEVNLGSSGLRLAGAHNIILGKNDSITLVWMSAQSKWIELSRVDSY